MAGQGQAFSYRNFHIDKTQLLGQGAYGAVYKAKCDQLPCAAKVLHPTILDPEDPGAGTIMRRFQRECSFLGNIRHPNIVQYLGMTTSRDPESRLELPVLLMELLDESLTKMLKGSQKPLAYYVEVNICHDIALAIAYLHSNGIIHRDLSSNNVLILAKSRAKVTDFGMSKLAGASPTMTPLTMCPGTLAYMAPEALREPPRYTEKLDCFSQGVIMIQVCTRLWPDPGPRTKSVPFPASPTGMTEVPVLEKVRRKNHIDLINRSHGLLPIALDCLNYQENERPSSEELCQRLVDLKDTRGYRESIDVVERKQNDTADLERHIEVIQQLQYEIQQQHLEHQSEIRLKDAQLQQQEEQLQSLNQKLEEQELITAEIQQTNYSLQRRVEQLREQLNRQIEPNSKPQLQVQHSVKTKRSLKSQDQVPIRGQLKLGKWKNGGRAPFRMIRGSAVVNGNVAYFMNSKGQICCYNSSTKRWTDFSECPQQLGTLAIIGGLLTTVGGESENRLLSIVNDGERKWLEHFPPMPTKRSRTAAVTTKRHLIVAGGYNRFDYLNTVEVMDIEFLAWSTAANLPHPYGLASAIICGDWLYMLGGSDKIGNARKSVLTCSLTKLLQSLSERLVWSKFTRSSDSVWSRIADVPVYYSTCAAINGELVAVGGQDEERKTTAAVCRYNTTSDSWDRICNMPAARYNCLVAVLPTNEMIVVGGDTAQSNIISAYTDKIDVVNILA